MAIAVPPTPPKFSALPTISLATFVRFDSADGNHQIDVVESRRSPEYDPMRDFYLSLRHQVRKLAGERNLAARNLLTFSDQIDDEAKQQRFRRLGKGYQAFEKRHRPKLGGI